MAKVWNDSRFTITCTQLHKVIRAGKFVTVSDEHAKLVPLNGIFRVEYDKTPAKKKKDPDAQHEDTSGSKAATSWFAGDPKKSSD